MISPVSRTICQKWWLDSIRVGPEGGEGTITLTGIKAPNPSSLTDGDRNDRYEEYEFTAWSRTRSGGLRKLSTIIDRNVDNDIVIIAEQPTVRVGNIGSGKGTLVISPDKAYETYGDRDARGRLIEPARKFTIEFTADGPMWDSQVNIVFPADLDDLDAAQVTRLLTATGSLRPTGNSGEFSIGNTGRSEVSLFDVTGGGEYCPDCNN